MTRSRLLRKRRQRGVTLVELVGTFLILAFVTLGTMQLYRVGDKTQRDARFYTDAQTGAREAVRRMIRTIRHGFAVETDAATTFNGSNPVSNTSQIIVKVPRPNDSTGALRDHIRFWVSGNTLYAQRNDDANSGLAIATGVQTLTFNYYQTAVTSSGTTKSSVDGTPASATEVQITLVLKSGTVTTTEAAYVELRNATLGF